MAFFLGERSLTVGKGHFPPQMVGIGQSGDGGVGHGVEICVLVDEGQALGFLCFSRSTKQSGKGNFQTLNFLKGLSGPPSTGPGKSVVCSVCSW